MMFKTFVCLLFLVSVCHAGKKPVVNVVLVGALGDLSKKYLFQAFSRVDQLRFTGNQPELVLWPGSRSKTDAGQKSMQSILQEHLKCKQGVDYILEDEIHECTSNQAEFKARVMPYMQLKYDDHYKELDAAIDAHNEEKNYVEAGRLMYLSIPPKAYQNVSRSIGQHVRPSSFQIEGTDSSADLKTPWLRVVFEKPFGSDEDSAEQLASDITESLEEHEIYRIDHYLGKVGVQIIYQFRQAHGDIYENLLNKKHVKHVEVVMKEETDCAGRAGYYDDYGVVRDLHQNHLSEMMALAMMDLIDEHDNEQGSSDSGSGAGNLMSMFKSYLYDSVRPPTLADAVIGQYAGYQTHVEQDRSKWMKDTEKIKQKSVIPTFASVRLDLMHSDRWKGVPVYVTSGKAMEEREAYVRFVFKNGETLLFNVQGGQKGTRGTSVIASDGLPEFYDIDGWQKKGPRKMIPLENPGAYDALVAKVWSGEASHFVSTDTLMASWRLWTPLLKELDAATDVPMSYTQGGQEMYKKIEQQFSIDTGRISDDDEEEEL
tara:strand:- start:146 stop:1771 length:1626 start_codon:yes stop_codon:yes gene_type:complete